MDAKRVVWLVVSLLMTVPTLSLSMPPGAAAFGPSPLGSPPVSYSEVGYVASLLIDGNVIWVGTHGGELVRLAVSSGAVERFRFPNASGPLRSLVRDRRGAIWVGSEEAGLGRFDGDWTVYTPVNSALPSSRVQDIALDETGDLWVATDAGLARIEGQTWDVYNTGNSGLVSDNVTSLSVDEAVWCGTDAGLSRFDAPWWTTYQATNSGLTDSRITALAHDGEGYLWAGTPSGLHRTDGGSDWHLYPDVPGPVLDILPYGSGDVWLNLDKVAGHLTACSLATFDTDTIGVKATRVAAIALDAQGRLWAGGEGGIARLVTQGERGNWRSTGIHRPVRALARQDGHLWIGLAGGGVVDLDTAHDRQVAYGTEHGLHAEVHAIAVDTERRVWFATWGGGLVAHESGRWTSYTATNSPLPSDYVTALAVVDGTLWVGTTSGLAGIVDGSEWEIINADEVGLLDERISALAAGPAGHLAVGTYGGGVAIRSRRGWEAFTAADSRLPSGYVGTLAFDGEGRLWVGMQGSGISCYDGEAWKAFRGGPGGLGGDFVRALAAGGQDLIWAGMEEGGLSGWDGCTWTTYRPDRSMMLGRINVLVADDGGLWLGTDGGLVSFEPPRPYPWVAVHPPVRSPAAAVVAVPFPQRAVYTEAPDHERWVTYAAGGGVRSLAFAEDGSLWAAATGGGAVRWDVAGETFTRFLSPQDGIGSNRVVYTAIDGQGRVWCGTQDNGVSVFDGATWTVYNTVNSGLAHDSVGGIAFDMEGRAWLATWGGGLSRFDGQDWVTFDTHNSGIADDWVSCVAVDAHNHVWVGTQRGLSVFEGSRWSTYEETYNVHSVAFDAEGTVWLGDGSGLKRVSGESVVAHEPADRSMYTGEVFAIDFDRRGKAWLGTSRGIFRLDGGELVPFNTATTGLRGKAVQTVKVDGTGRVWFGTDGEDGVAFWDGKFWHDLHTTAGPNPVGYTVAQVFIDDRDRVWMGTDQGLSLYDHGMWTNFTPHNSGLPDVEVRVLAQDPLGRIWIGTPGGISIYADGGDWELLTPENSGLPDRGILAILFDRNGRAWVGSGEGVSCYDGTAWKTYTPENSLLPAGEITHLVEDADGRIWIGSAWSGMVVVVDGDVWTPITPADYGLENWTLDTIAADPSGPVWLASMDRIAILRGDEWYSYPEPPFAMAGYSVSSVAFDGSGRIWVGGYGGMTYFDGEVWTKYTPENSPLVGENVRDIAVDARGHVWIAVAEGGVSEWVPPQRLPRSPSPPRSATAPAAAPDQGAVPEPSKLEASGIFIDVWKELGREDGPLGWADGPAREIRCADQRFENGYMFWRNMPDGDVVYVLLYDAARVGGAWQAFADTFAAGQPESAGHVPPPGLYEPVRGFGKVWREQLGGKRIPPSIGWAIEPEQGMDTAQCQDFQGGTLLFSPRLGTVFVLFSDGSWKARPAP